MTSDVLPGTFLGPCNRTACRAPNATWFNRGMALKYAPECHRTIDGVYYCVRCARLINEFNALGDRAMCIPLTDPAHPWFEAPELAQDP